MTDPRTTHCPPCVGYHISQSTGAGVCIIHGRLPLKCVCGDYSPDFDAHGYRAQRWQRLLQQQEEYPA